MEPFSVKRIAKIENHNPNASWLIEYLWAQQAVGFIAGTPKTGKTWLALEIAFAVATGKPCLKKFHVKQVGNVLIYPAEDDASQIKHRFKQIATAHGLLDIAHIPVGLIEAGNLHIDNPEHQEKLRITVLKCKPKLLILDPFIRLHNADENSAGAVNNILSFLRDLQKQNNVAIILVHHLRKSPTADPGQALRGSGDLHAWSDSNLFMLQKEKHIELHPQHRAHPTPKPCALKISQEPATHLVLEDLQAKNENDQALKNRILEALSIGPATQHSLRRILEVRNETLSITIQTLVQDNHVHRKNGKFARNFSNQNA